MRWPFCCALPVLVVPVRYQPPILRFPPDCRRTRKTRHSGWCGDKMNGCSCTRLAYDDWYLMKKQSGTLRLQLRARPYADTSSFLPTSMSQFPPDFQSLGKRLVDRVPKNAEMSHFT